LKSLQENCRNIYIVFRFIAVMGKRFSGLFLISLLLATMFVGVVSAADVFDPVKRMFTDWESGSLSLNLAKYVLFFILILVIYTIFEFVPVIGGHKAITWILSVLVSFLAAAFNSF
jgi:hypothetical protein